ncbi:MAG: sulfotransferase, partial [Alphaproteobacteria bacterium]
MNRKERRASGVKGTRGDQSIINSALKMARELEEKGHSGEATKLYQKILQYDPDNTVALLDVGIDTYGKGDAAAAEQIFNKILRLDPKNGGALTGLGMIRMDEGRKAEALQFAERAIRLEPSAGALTKLGDLYREAGQLDRAREYILAALKKKPDYVTAYYSLQPLVKFTPEDVAKMTEVSKMATLSADDKIRMSFTLGKASMDIGQTDLAFWHFAEANLFKRATYKFKISSFEEYVDNIIRMFDEATVTRLRGKVKGKGGNQIFIVGMPRSGSTLIDQILSSHPDVASVGEAKFISSSIPAFPNMEMPAYFREGVPSITKPFMDALSPEMLEVIGDKYMSLAAPFGTPGQRIVDKMLFNYMWVGILRLALPDARIIHSMRDPVDMGLSIWQLLFSAEMPWAYDQTEIGRYTLGYKKLMQHWQKLFPDEIYDAKYESIVANQEQETRKLLQFCGLAWNEKCLNFHQSERVVKTASSTQVRKPIYKDSVKK